MEWKLSFILVLFFSVEIYRAENTTQYVGTILPGNETEVVSEVKVAVESSTEPIKPMADEDLTCDETLYNDQEIISPNYPEPYPAEYTRVWCLNMTEGTGVDIVIDTLDIDPKKDYLYIRGANLPKEQDEPVYVTGNTGAKLKFLETNEVAIKFVGNQQSGHAFKGFKIQVAGNGKEATTTEEPSTTTPGYSGDYITIIKDLVMSKELQEEQTTFTEVIRTILMESTNDWLKHHDLDERMESCRLEDVKIHKIHRCPKSWPNNEDCVRLEFAIPLNESDYEVLTKPESDIVINEEYELTAENLELVWSEFAKNRMRDGGFEEYYLPDAKGILLVWISVSLVIVFAFIFVLYGIWKFDFLTGYNRMAEEREETEHTKRQSNLDPSLWPSPNQMVPPFLAEQDTFTGYDPKFVVTEPEDSVFDARQQRGMSFSYEVGDYDDHPQSHHNPFASEIEKSEQQHTGHSYPRNF